MSKYTIADVGHIIPVEQTATTIEAVEAYLNKGTIPDFDPCLSCEPNHVRKLISLIQVAERNGLWPPKRSESKPKVDDNYTPGDDEAPEVALKAKRPEMFESTKTKEA